MSKPASGSVTLTGENGKKYRLLVQNLSEPNFARLLAEHVLPSQHDKLGDALTNINLQLGTSLGIIRALIDMEYKSKLFQPTTILRVNSIVSKMIGRFAKILGVEYVKKLLTGLITDIYARPEEDWELEKEKMKIENPDEKVALNLKTVEVECQKFIDRIVSNQMLAEVPRELRAICYFMAENGRMHNLEHLTLPLVSGFIILRFICSAVAVPNNFGITSALPKDNVRKNLVLISKIITKLANGEKFDSELHMVPLNEFLERNRQKLNNWLSALCVDPSPAAESPSDKPFADLLKAGSFEDIHYKTFEQKDLTLVHNLFFDNAYEIYGTMQVEALKKSKESGSNVATKESSSLIALQQEFIALLKDLYTEDKAAAEEDKKDDAAAASPAAAASSSGTNVAKKKGVSFKGKKWPEIEALIIEKGISHLVKYGEGLNSALSALDLSRFLYIGRPTKSNMPVVYLIMSRLTRDTVRSCDLFLVYVLKQLFSVFSQKYVLIVDMSWGEVDDEVQSGLYRGIASLARMLKPEYFLNCHQIYLLHPNFQTLLVLEDVLNLMAPETRNRLVKVAYDWLDLREAIEPSNIWIPFLSKKFTPITFHVIKKTSQHRRERQLKITNDSIMDICPITWQVKSEIVFSKIVEVRSKGNEIHISYMRESADDRAERGCEYISKFATRPGVPESNSYVCYSEQQCDILAEALFEAGVRGVSLYLRQALVVQRQVSPGKYQKNLVKLTADSIISFSADKKKILLEIPYATVQSAFVDEKEATKMYVNYMHRGARKQLVWVHDRAADVRAAILDSLQRFKFSIELEKSMLYKNEYDIIVDAVFSACKIPDTSDANQEKRQEVFPVEVARAELKKFYKRFKPKQGQVPSNPELVVAVLANKCNLTLEKQHAEHILHVWDSEARGYFYLDDIVKSWVTVRREKNLLQKKREILKKKKK